MQEPKEIKLPSGKTATIAPFKGKVVFEAQRRAGTDTDRYMPWMIALTTKIDGQPIVVEDLDEMDGPDVLTLIGEFGSGFTLPEK